MTFTSANTAHRQKINDDILRVLKRDRGMWMSASEISERIRGRADSRGVGHRLVYLTAEFPIESMVRKEPWPWVKLYRYVGSEGA